MGHHVNANSLVRQCLRFHGGIPSNWIPKEASTLVTLCLPHPKPSPLSNGLLVQIFFSTVKYQQNARKRTGISCDTAVGQNGQASTGWSVVKLSEFVNLHLNLI
jgi:hypothetical protein